jgi:N-acetylglutamate synthase-like GNAT family acetyltransferase
MRKTILNYKLTLGIFFSILYSFINFEYLSAEQMRDYFIGKKAIHFTLMWHDPKTLTVADHEQIKQLFTFSFLKTYRLSEAYSEQIVDSLIEDFNTMIIPHFYQESPLFLLGATIENNWIGYALFEKIAEHTMYLAEMAISPDYWNLGLGRKMTFSIFNLQPSIEKLVVLTEWINTRTHLFYEAIGFQPSSYSHPGYDSKKFRAYEFLRNSKKNRF